MEKETPNRFLDDSVDIEILSAMDGKKNITDISKETGLTYKSVFHRIKRMEESKWIIPHKTKDITQGICFTIDPSFNAKIEKNLQKYKSNTGLFKESLKYPGIKPQLQDLLRLIEKKRLISKIEINEYLYEKYCPSMEMDKGKIVNGEEYRKKLENYMQLSFARGEMEALGLIRSREELTRAGIKFLKELYEENIK